MDLLLPHGLHRRQRHVVVLPWRQLAQRIRRQLPVGQEAAPGVQAPGHVDHEAVGDVRRLAAPGDQRRVGGHMTQREVLRGEGP